MIRLQKRIADSGLTSRRKAEELIESGQVKVNGKVVSKLGSKVEEGDQIEVSGKLLSFNKTHTSIVINKAQGMITSKSDPYHSNTIYSMLPAELKHLKPAGRLDKDSEGLLILSSDGELIQKLSHPKHGHTKEYKVLVKGMPSEKDLVKMTTGNMHLDGYRLNPMMFEILHSTKDRKTWLTVTLTEGRNRQVRRVLDSLGFPVIYLARTAIGKLRTKLKTGTYKVLSDRDIEAALS